MRLEVKHDDRRVAGGHRAELGDRDTRLAEELEEERLELVVGAVDLVDQQHDRLRTGMADRAEQRPVDEELGREQVVGGERLGGCLGGTDGQQLARVVPLVERLARRDALVALQPHEWGVEGRGQRLGRLRLADAGLALEQQGLAQGDGAEGGRRQPEVGHVVDGVEPLAQRGDVELLHHV